DLFRRRRAAMGNPPVVAHNCYLINMASPDASQRKRSVDAMVDEIQKCAQIGVENLVAHPGAHLDAPLEDGMAHIASSMKEVLEQTANTDVRILLETTAGQGSSIGHRFEHLRDLLGA